MQNECVARVRAVAPLLRPYPPVFTGEALRIGLLERVDGAPLPAFSAAIDEWLDELSGPFQSEAQIELKLHGPSSLVSLVEHWDRLSESDRKWLIEWATEINADAIVLPVRKVLAERYDGLILVALEAVAKLKTFPADFENLLIPFLQHGHDVIRRAAVMACRSAFDWRQFLRTRAFRHCEASMRREGHSARGNGRDVIRIAATSQSRLAYSLCRDRRSPLAWTTGRSSCVNAPAGSQRTGPHRDRTNRGPLGGRRRTRRIPSILPTLGHQPSESEFSPKPERPRGPQSKSALNFQADF